MAIATLDELFLHTLKDVLYAERRISKALPKMQRKATDEKLAQLLAEHRDETEGQIERLEQVFELLEKSARGAKCEAIVGIIEEAEHLMEEVSDDAAMDAALIALAQAVEHYEMARYGTLVAWAQEMGMKDAARLLTETLEQEKATDRKLSALASKGVNKKAA